MLESELVSITTLNPGLVMSAVALPSSDDRSASDCYWPHLLLHPIKSVKCLVQKVHSMSFSVVSRQIQPACVSLTSNLRVVAMRERSQRHLRTSAVTPLQNMSHVVFPVSRSWPFYQLLLSFHDSSGPKVPLVFYIEPHRAATNDCAPKLVTHYKRALIWTCAVWDRLVHI